MTFEPAERQQAENIARGTFFALVALPAGVIVWVILWNLGIIASIVGFGVAYAAMFLYRFGSGGALSRTGAVRIALVTIGTLVVAFFAGVVSDVLGVWTTETGNDAMSSLVSPEFWTAFQQVIGLDGVAAGYLPDFGLALLFGAVGCFGLLRRAFRSSKAEAKVAPVYRAAPAAAAVPSTFDFGSIVVPPAAVAATGATEPASVAEQAPADDQAQPAHDTDATT